MLVDEGIGKILAFKNVKSTTQIYLTFQEFVLPFLQN